ncbi:MAG: hypothetical protein J7J97_05540 [Thermococcus sp.]|nr:hypothetical protein [Thermococcus sp.]
MYAGLINVLLIMTNGVISCSRNLIRAKKPSHLQNAGGYLTYAAVRIYVMNVIQHVIGMIAAH